MVEHTNIGLGDFITFGKYKGQTVEAVFKEDHGYLVWLRETKRVTNANTRFFDLEVNTLLDMAIEESKPLKKKYQTWKALGLLNVQPEAQPEEESALTPEPEVAYQGAWGAF